MSMSSLTAAKVPCLSKLLRAPGEGKAGAPAKIIRCCSRGFCMLRTFLFPTWHFALPLLRVLNPYLSSSSLLLACVLVTLPASCRIPAATSPQEPSCLVNQKLAGLLHGHPRRAWPMSLLVLPRTRSQATAEMRDDNRPSRRRVPLLDVSGT